MRLEVRFHADTENPVFGIALRNEVGQPVFATSTNAESVKTGSSPPATPRIRFRFENWLAPGRYRLLGDRRT